MNGNSLPLRDMHMPEAISWWPPAIGWWLLAILIPLLVAALVYLYRRITRKTALKSAKKLLQALRQDTEQNDYEKLCALSILLRRTAISCYPRTETAALTGQQWLLFLDQIMLGQPFSEGEGQCLKTAPYQKPEATTFAIESLLTLCEHWLKALSKVKK